MLHEELKRGNISLLLSSMWGLCEAGSWLQLKGMTVTFGQNQERIVLHWDCFHPSPLSAPTASVSLHPPALWNTTSLHQLTWWRHVMCWNYISAAQKATNFFSIVGVSMVTGVSTGSKELSVITARFLIFSQTSIDSFGTKTILKLYNVKYFDHNYFPSLPLRIFLLHFVIWNNDI